MISIGEYLINPAYVLGAKFEGESGVRIYLSAPISATRTSILLRCSSPQERSTFTDALLEEIERVNGVRD